MHELLILHARIHLRMSRLVTACAVPLYLVVQFCLRAYLSVIKLRHHKEESSSFIAMVTRCKQKALKCRVSLYFVLGNTGLGGWSNGPKARLL